MYARAYVPLFAHNICPLLRVHNDAAAGLRGSQLDVVDRRCNRIDKQLISGGALCCGIGLGALWERSRERTPFNTTSTLTGDFHVPYGAVVCVMVEENRVLGAYTDRGRRSCRYVGAHRGPFELESGRWVFTVQQHPDASVVISGRPHEIWCVPTLMQ